MRLRRLSLTSLCLAALAAMPLAAVGVQASSARFTASKPVGANSVTVDTLANYFAVAPGAATQVGSGTKVAAGDVDTLTLGLGTVPSARTFANVFTVTNTTASTQTAVLAFTGAPQVAAVAFAGGSQTAAIVAGATVQVNLTTSSTVAGLGAGTLRLRLGGSTWLYRDYALTVAEAPEAPPALTGAQRPAGAIALSWGASTTTTNLGGYDVYRGATKVAAVTGPTTWTDTATVDGTSYTYTVKARSTDAAPLSSLASPAATAVADAAPPATPTAVSTGSYVNATGQASISVGVTLPAGSSSADLVTVTLASGGASVGGTAAATQGAGTVTVSGIDASSLPDGAVTVTATSADPAGNSSTAATSSTTKDTVAPGVPTASYTDNKNSPDAISGSAEAGAAITVTRTLPAPTTTFTGTATAGGTYSVIVSQFKNTTVTYTVTARDAAGNTSGAAPITFATTQ
jgi:large repetitive protein